MSSIVGLLTLNIFIPGAQSLKDKRRVLRKIKDRARHRFNVSMAETDFLDKWQRSQLTVACVSNEQVQVEKSLQQVRRFMEDICLGEAEILSADITYY